MNDKIEHQGVVESIADGHVRVSIVQVAACSECKAKALCTSSESREKFIDVYGHYADRYKVGDTVRVCGSLTMGRKAVRLAFVWPTLIVLVGCFLSVAVLKLPEGVALGLTLLPLAAYFALMYLGKDKISREFAFWIEEQL